MNEGIGILIVRAEQMSLLNEYVKNDNVCADFRTRNLTVRNEWINELTIFAQAFDDFERANGIKSFSDWDQLDRHLINSFIDAQRKSTGRWR